MDSLKCLAEMNLISSEAHDLISRLLVPNQDERISAAEALKHPWFNGMEI